MYRTILCLVSALCLGVGMLSAQIHGQYKLDPPANPDQQTQRPGGRGANRGARGAGGGIAAMSVVLDLSEQDGKLTGKATIGEGQQARSVEVTNGKVSGDKFSFETTLETPRARMTWIWEGTATEGALNGTRKTKDYPRPPQPFSAKRVEE